MDLQKDKCKQQKSIRNVNLMFSDVFIFKITQIKALIYFFALFIVNNCCKKKIQIIFFNVISPDLKHQPITNVFISCFRCV